MIKEDKNIDFYTTGKQPSEHDFARISEWIEKDKQRRKPLKSTNQATKQMHLDEQSALRMQAEEGTMKNH